MAEATPPPAARRADNVVTQSMLKEEEELQRQSQTDTAQLKEEVKSEYKELVQNQRFARLKHLLERSSLYTDFLYQRMQAQQAEAQKKQERKQQPKAKTPATGAANAAAKTDHSLRHKTPAAPKRRGPAKRTSKRTAKDTDASYALADYVDPEEAEEAKRRAEQHDADDNANEADADRPEMEQPELVTGGKMRDYQLAGVAWMKALFENGLNGILADEMGLGKTVQTIAFFAHLYKHKVRGPYLVVAPLSTLSNWMREFNRWAPDIPVVLYHGTPEERAEKRASILTPDAKLQSFMTVVTSYEIVMRDRRALQDMPWKYIVVDEGHRLKNLNCRLIKELKMYQSANRMLLTGTPLQNNLAELWSLLNFLLPDIFDDLDSFQRWFDFSEVHEEQGDDRILAKEQEGQVLSKLHQILQPFLLRRLKTDVVTELPPKRELVLYAPLTQEQQTYYQSLLDRRLLNDIAERTRTAGMTVADPDTPASPATSPANKSPAPKKRKAAAKAKSYREQSDREYFNALGEADGDDDVTFVDAIERDAIHTSSVVTVSMQNMVMQLRKCCNHPYLLEYPLSPTGEYRIDEELVTSSGKLQLLDRLLPALRAQGHKVLIFSQMTKMLDILQDYCWLRKFGFCRLDGSVSYSDREEQIAAFDEDPDKFVFLLSTRAGGLGINLMAADTCIIYDSDWNPQADLQAQDRCHRIGQKETVLVYRLITANTIDQRILERAEAKRKLERMVIHKGRFKGKGKEQAALTPQELKDLLRDTDAHKIGSGGEVLSDEALAQVLDRRPIAEMTGGEDAPFRVIEQVAGSTSIV